MDALFGLSILVGIIAILLIVGVAAAAVGVDSRPGFCEDRGHCDSVGGNV